MLLVKHPALARADAGRLRAVCGETGKDRP